MSRLRWSNFFAVYLTPYAFCLQSFVQSGNVKLQDFSVELTAKSVQQLTALMENMDKRLVEVEKVQKRLELRDKIDKGIEVVDKMDLRLDLMEKMERKFENLEKIEKIFNLLQKLEKGIDLGEVVEKGYDLMEKKEKEPEIVGKMEQTSDLVKTMKKRPGLLEEIAKRREKEENIQKFKRSFEGHGEKIQESSAAETHSSRLHKRSDDIASWQPLVAQVTQRLSQAEADIQVLKNSVAAQERARGSVYVRWGHESCPGLAETVYSGFIGGPWYADTGSGSDYLCLPSKNYEIQFESHTIPKYGHAELFGAEYETCNEPQCDLTPACAVCRISRESSMMLPARQTCYYGWTLEYSGYLMTNSPHHGANMEYICVDSSLGSVPFSTGNQDGALLYYTTYFCGSLPCPPYINNQIVLCAVCSK